MQLPTEKGPNNDAYSSLETSPLVRDEEEQ